MTMPYTILPADGPDAASEWVRLGTEAYSLGRLPTAERNYRRALKIDPCNPTANNNLGIVLACQGNKGEALLAMERAALFDGVEPVIAANRALANFENDRIEEARAAAETAIGLSPTAPENPNPEEMKTAGYLRARLAYAVIAAAYGHPEDALPKYREMLAIEPTHPAAGPNCCFNQTLSECTAQELHEQRKFWRSVNGWKGKTWPNKNVRDPDKVLKVGYVGGDYKSHSAAMIFSNVLLNHDKSQVDLYLYSTLPTEAEKDDMTQMLMAAGQWRDIVTKSDDEIEDLITKDGIDVLVDLAGHTNGGRLAVFTRRPAPVQVTAWGFAHGTGCPEIDYFFADPVAVPECERQFYAEQIWDLPCIVTYRPPNEYAIPPDTPPPAARNGHVTFGSFSRFEKLSDKCLACFAEILSKVPGSKLYLKDAAFRRPYSIKRVLDALPGIDRKRVMFGVATSHPEHMIEYQNVDLVLDPFPHGGGNVALETLYAGVPLVTRYGRQPSGRTASSVLTAIGRTDWIAKDEAEYVAKAVALARDPAALAKPRNTLREELVESPVVKGYAGAVERAYRAMWKAWCESK